MSLLVAEPQKKGLGRELLKRLYDSAQSSYDQSQSAADQTTGKVAIVVFAIESSINFYEKCGYRTISNIADVSVKHRQSPLSDVIMHFNDTKHPIHMSNTTAMLLFPHRHALMVYGSLRMEEQFRHLDKSNGNLVGALIHITFNSKVKYSLSKDADLAKHLSHNIYKSKNELQILAIVTARMGDAYDVLFCIDRSVALKEKEMLRKLVTNASCDEKGYLFRRFAFLNVPPFNTNPNPNPNPSPKP